MRCSAKVLHGVFLFGECEAAEDCPLCLVHIFQVNDLGCLKAHPKVGFLLGLQQGFNFCFHFCPQKLVKNTNLGFRNWVLSSTLLVISIVASAGYFMEIRTSLVYVRQIK